MYGSFIDVGLWNATGTTLLGSVRLISAGQVIDSWRWHQLASPQVLQADTQYLIGAPVGGGIEWFQHPAPFSAGDRLAGPDGSGHSIRSHLLPHASGDCGKEHADDHCRKGISGFFSK